MSAPEDGFQNVADLVCDRVRDQLAGFILGAGLHPEAHQAICLGALAGIVETWVFANGGTATEARMTEALQASVADFVGQAYAKRRAAAQ